MPDTKTKFAQLDEIRSSQGTAAALDFLANEFREEARYFEMFEILKMQIRHRMNLPLTFDETAEALTEAQQRELEDGLFEACRTVGTLLMQAGQVGEGWTFLRPVGDKQLARELVEAIEVTDENVDAIVHVALSEGVAPAYGFQLVLERFGTCNSITTYDAEISRQPKEEQQKAAALLVKHLHGELLENVRADIERREEAAPKETTLRELLEHRPQLLEANAYHIDTTHLASVVRFARVLSEPDQLATAVDLTEYGLRLGKQYHYEGDEPFGDLYQASKLYLNALRGVAVDEAIAYFGDKARTQDIQYYGPVSIETYIDLLTRVGRLQQAITESIELLPDGPRVGIAKSLFDLCKRADDFDQLRALALQREDLLGYAMGRLHATD
jgi:hypothetical protein